MSYVLLSWSEGDGMNPGFNHVCFGPFSSRKEAEEKQTLLEEKHSTLNATETGDLAEVNLFGDHVDDHHPHFERCYDILKLWDWDAAFPPLDIKKTQHKRKK